MSRTRGVARLVVAIACVVAGFCVPSGVAARSVTSGSLTETLGAKWHGPNVAVPVRAASTGWENVGQAEGYRLQRHRRLGYYRLLDPANVRLAWGSREYCEDALGRQLEAPEQARRRLNLALPTLGGLQFWGDELIYCGWRIQRNALSGHFRLLDPRDVRRAWGTFEECEKAFRQLVDKQTVRPRSDQFVLLLHGLMRARRSFRQMEKLLTEQGYEVIAVKYPSTQTSIEEQAAQLARIMARLDGARQVHLVTHSLGGLIVRCYLRDHRDARIGRLVMLAPPNQGSLMAEMLADWFPYRVATGPAGQQLVGKSAPFIASLPAPWCEFAVIAGGRGDSRGYSPLLEGDDDGVVRVEETRLRGMRDFLIIPSLHTFMMSNDQAHRAIVQFFQTGRFGAGAPPQRPADEATTGGAAAEKTP